MENKEPDASGFDDATLAILPLRWILSSSESRERPNRQVIVVEGILEKPNLLHSQVLAYPQYPLYELPIEIRLFSREQSEPERGIQEHLADWGELEPQKEYWDKVSKNSIGYIRYLPASQHHDRAFLWSELAISSQQHDLLRNSVNGSSALPSYIELSLLQLPIERTPSSNYLWNIEEQASLGIGKLSLTYPGVVPDFDTFGATHLEMSNFVPMVIDYLDGCFEGSYSEIPKPDSAQIQQLYAELLASAVRTAHESGHGSTRATETLDNCFEYVLDIVGTLHYAIGRCNNRIGEASEYNGPKGLPWHKRNPLTAFYGGLKSTDHLVLRMESMGEVAEKYTSTNWLCSPTLEWLVVDIGMYWATVQTGETLKKGRFPSLEWFAYLGSGGRSIQHSLLLGGARFLIGGLKALLVVGVPAGIALYFYQRGARDEVVLLGGFYAVLLGIFVIASIARRPLGLRSGRQREHERAYNAYAAMVNAYNCHRAWGAPSETLEAVRVAQGKGAAWGSFIWPILVKSNQREPGVWIPEEFADPASSPYRRTVGVLRRKIKAWAENRAGTKGLR